MRKLIVVIMCLACTTARAQLLKQLAPDPAFTQAITSIVSDYPHNYRNIQGEEIEGTGNASLFKSTVSLPGSDQCMIYRFNSVEDSTASWQAVLYKGESYAEAAKIYRNTFKAVQRSRINTDMLSAGFMGKMEAPTEDLRFTSSTLHLGTHDAMYKNFVAEVEMINNYDGWEVHLNMHYKRDDDQKY